MTDPKEPDKPVSTVFIYDYENKCFLMLLGNADSKTGIISTLPSDSAIVAMGKNQKSASNAQIPEQKMDAGKRPTITKTGNSRIIAGYKCDEYKVVEPDVEGYSDIWMTKDLKINADKNYWGKTGMPSYYGYPEFEGSVMLAMDSYDKKDNPTMKMETKEINQKVSRFAGLFTAVRVRLREAIQRGEAHPDVDPDRLIELIGGAAHAADAVAPVQKLDDAWVEQTTAILVHGVTR